MIETSKFARKPFEVEAVQVTTDNLEEVATWCKGELTTEGDTKFIKVDVANFINERQTKAFVGDWVLYASNGYKVYTNKAFKKNFELVPGTVGQALNEAQKKVSIAIG